MAKVANIDPFKNFPGWNPVEKHKNHGQNQKASHMEPFGGNLWHCGWSRQKVFKKDILSKLMSYFV